jgi:ABC-2 type transport system permease protein
MPLYNTSYQHWQGQHRGLWHGRLTIVRHGLKACFQGKWIRRIATACWCLSLGQAALLFFIGQLLVPDSLIVTSLDKFNPQLRAIAQGLMAWLQMHPEVSVGSTENFLFYYFSRFYVPLVMLALALAIPHLICRDIASNALTIYASKAVTRGDYLAGKFGTVFGLLGLLWLGPVCVAWALGNLLAPYWHFFWHSRAALGHVLVYVVSSMAALSGLAMGASAISGREKIPVGLWIGLWMMGGFLANHAVPRRAMDSSIGPTWIEHLSVSANLDQIAAATFRLTRDLELAQQNIPFVSSLTRNIRAGVLQAWQSPDVAGAILGLGLMLAAAAALVYWRAKPE